jgi:hypothetical protein
MYTVEIIENSKGMFSRYYLKSNSKRVPRKKSIIYFCIYRTTAPDYSDIMSVEKWGGSFGFFYNMLNNINTPKRIVELIKSKRVIF